MEACRDNGVRRCPVCGIDFWALASAYLLSTESESKIEKNTTILTSVAADVKNRSLQIANLPVRPLRRLCATRRHKDGIDRLAARHKEAILLAPAKAKIGAGFG